jgi:hypothetical protein
VSELVDFAEAKSLFLEGGHLHAAETVRSG